MSFYKFIPCIAFRFQDNLDYQENDVKYLLIDLSVANLIIACASQLKVSTGLYFFF